ncbi:MAG: Hsp70 ATPase ssc1 [Cyphobasidiales sp. Tagirdzhanova-0007]|nr:MAG: Hsp70 ATPase ssc1 [Cyphobasidiales sp. Tagirdzhanova-0007]
MSTHSFPYQESDLRQILTLSSFFFLLNAARLLCDYLANVGILAGAALSSTSLGTTFSVISQAGYGKTRLGAVLTSAAITDDVVSLILLQVVVSLGSITTSSSLEARNGASEIGWAVGQPLLASLGMLGVSWAMLQWVVGPAYAWMTGKLSVIKARQAHAYNLLMGLLVSSAYAAVASASGSETLSVTASNKLNFTLLIASVLLGAFVASLVLASLSRTLSRISPTSPSFEKTYEHHLRQVQTYFLRPLFFASIGLLSVFTKLITGGFVMIDYFLKKMKRSKGRKSLKNAAIVVQPAESAGLAQTTDPIEGGSTSGTCVHPPLSPSTALPEQELVPSLLPVSLLLGSAMVARGEVSLLIANLAKVKSPHLSPDDLFSITIWVILLCTIAGPVLIGMVVKHMTRQGILLPVEWGPTVPEQRQAHSEVRDLEGGSDVTSALSVPDQREKSSVATTETATGSV